MLRRTKTSVEVTVPPREELTVFIPLTEAQRFWTYRLLTRMDTVDLKSIFTSKIEADSDDTIDHGRQQVQAILREQMNDEKVKPAGEERRSGMWCVLADPGVAWKRLMNLLIQLRMVCDQ